MNYSCDYTLVTSDFTDKGGNIYIWDGQTGVNLITLSGQKLANNSIAIVKNTIVACVENKSLLEIWKLNSEGKKKVIPLPAPAKAINYYEPLNILSCFLGFDIFLWQPETGQLLKILNNVHSHVGAQILFTTKNNIITIDESGLIVCWKMNIEYEFSDVLWKTRPFGMGKCNCVLIEEKEQLFVASENGKFIIISLYSGKPISDLIDLAMTIKCVERYKDRVFIGCNQGTLVIFSLCQRIIIKKIVVKDCSEIDHAVTHLALSPDEKSLILLIDGRMALTISSFLDDFTPKRPFTFGMSINNLRTVMKHDDMFAMNNDMSKILIKRLNFEYEKSLTIKEVDINIIRQARSAREIIDELDISCDDIYQQLRFANDDKMHNDKLMDCKINLFSVLNK